MHTVDVGVWRNLIPTIKNHEKWDFLIAHFLGVDHAGHTYRVESQEMVNKVIIFIFFRVVFYSIMKLPPLIFIDHYFLTILLLYLLLVRINIYASI